MPEENEQIPVEKLIEAYLAVKGLPPMLAPIVMESVDTLADLVNAQIEKAHAQTFLAYVQAGANLLAVEDADPSYVALGKQVLDVARAMFEDAVAGDGDEEAPPVLDKPRKIDLDPDLLT